MVKKNGESHLNFSLKTPHVSMMELYISQLEIECLLWTLSQNEKSGHSKQAR